MTDPLLLANALFVFASAVVWALAIISMMR
jgi:hypothetical protein